MRGKGHGTRNYSFPLIEFITLKGFDIYFATALGLWQLGTGETLGKNLIYSSTFEDEGETLGNMILAFVS